MTRLLLCSVVLLALISGAQAQDVAMIDFLGYGWETGGMKPSTTGDELRLTATASYVDPAIEVDLGLTEVTIYVSGLMSEGEQALGSDTLIEYSGGTLVAYADGARNADWGVLPPNITTPATFNDGSLLFQGEFEQFQVAMSASGAGVFQGRLKGVHGPLLTSCDNCIFTWGGSFTADAGGQILEGYDLQLDGALEIDESVPSESSGWGALKALFGGEVNR